MSLPEHFLNLQVVLKSEVLAYHTAPETLETFDDDDKDFLKVLIEDHLQQHLEELDLSIYIQETLDEKHLRAPEKSDRSP